MRKISTFSANLSFSRTSKDTNRKVYSDKQSQVERNVSSAPAPSGEISMFMTQSMIAQSIKEMKKSINIRFLQLIKSVKAYANSNPSAEDLGYLKKFVTIQLTMMLGEYVELLSSNPGIQLQTYLKINSVLPDAMESCRTLSKVMIKCSKIRKSTGTLPPRNQHDLNRTMNEFISTIIDLTIGSINIGDPFITN